MLKSYFLLTLFFLNAGAISLGQTKSTEVPSSLRLAREMCALKCDIYGLVQLITIEKAKGSNKDIISEIRHIQDRLFSDYDSLEVLFQSAVHNPQLDFFYEADKHAWFLYCQDFLHQRGINLSANDRFNYVDFLSKEGNVTVKLRRVINDTVLTNYFIDSAAYTIIDRYYPNWKNSPVERIQKLDVGIDAFIEFSKNRYVPFIAQTELMNCGPTCLKMVLDQFGKYYSLDELAGLSDLDDTGTSFGDLTRAALQLNMTAESYKMSYEDLRGYMDRPVIVHWDNVHFVVAYAMNEETVWIADPDLGRIHYSRADFCERWLYGTEKTSEKGSVLIFKLGKDFYN